MIVRFMNLLFLILSDVRFLSTKLYMLGTLHVLSKARWFWFWYEHPSLVNAN